MLSFPYGLLKNVIKFSLRFVLRNICNDTRQILIDNQCYREKKNTEKSQKMKKKEKNKAVMNLL